MVDEPIEIDFQLAAEDQAKSLADTSASFIVKPSKLKLALPIIVLTLFGLCIFWVLMYALAFAMGTRDFQGVTSDLSRFTTFEFFASYGIIILCFVAILENIYENAHKDSKNFVLRMIVSGKNKAMFSPAQAVLSKDDVRVHSDFINCTFKWTGIEKVEIQDGDFCIFYSSISALCIPLRFFASEQEKQAIYQKCQIWFLDANKNAA